MPITMHDQTLRRVTPAPRHAVSARAIWFLVSWIGRGEKKEEYREIKPWIISRLEGKTYDAVEFSNGYGAHVPKVTVEYQGWHRGPGRSEWGATWQGSPYAVIRLGRVLSRQNDRTLATQPAPQDPDS